MFASYFTIKSVSSSCVAYPYFKISHVELILNMYTESQSSNSLINLLLISAIILFKTLLLFYYRQCCKVVLILQHIPSRIMQNTVRKVEKYIRHIFYLFSFSVR